MRRAWYCSHEPLARCSLHTVCLSLQCCRLVWSTQQTFKSYVPGCCRLRLCLGRSRTCKNEVVGLLQVEYLLRYTLFPAIPCEGLASGPVSGTARSA